MTQRVLPVSASWQAIAWNGSVFCAVVSGGTIAATSNLLAKEIVYEL